MTVENYNINEVEKAMEEMEKAREDAIEQMEREYEEIIDMEDYDELPPIS